MRIKLSERLAALFLSLVMVLSCAAPYGFAAEADAEPVDALIDAEPVEAPEDNADAVPVEVAETDNAEAVTDAAPMEAPETDADTVSGWVMEKLGKIPEGNESFEYGGYLITISEIVSRRITEVKVKKLEEEPEDEEKEEE